MKDFLGESWRTTLSAIGALLGLVAMVWLALVYNNTDLLKILIPLIPIIIGLFAARDQKAHEESQQPKNGG